MAMDARDFSQSLGDGPASTHASEISPAGTARIAAAAEVATTAATEV